MLYQSELERALLLDQEMKEKPIPEVGSRSAPCSLMELIEDELRDLWQWGYDREPREESVKPRLDAIMRIIEANAESNSADLSA